MLLPVSFNGGGRYDIALRLYYKTVGMVLRSLTYKIFNPRTVDGIALIHKSVVIMYPGKLRLGRFCVLNRNGRLNALSIAGVHIGGRVTIGDNFWIQGTSHLSDLGDGLWIGDNTYIGPNAVIGFHGPVRIGRSCAIGANFQVSAQSHDLKSKEGIAVTVEKSIGISIGNNVWIGNDVKILDGVCIGDMAVIGAGSVVTKDVGGSELAVGVPARIVKKL